MRKDKTWNGVESNCPEARPKLARAMREEIKKVSPLDFQTEIIPIANFVKTNINMMKKSRFLSLSGQPEELKSWATPTVTKTNCFA